MVSFNLTDKSTFVRLTAPFPKLLHLDLCPHLHPLVVLLHLLEVELHADSLQVMVLRVKEEDLHGIERVRTGLQRVI